MTWSLGEIGALSVKAARGAGLDWGLAEEAGFAVQWLETHGLEGTKALSQYLSRVHRNDKYNTAYCPLKLGCLASDLNDWNKLQGLRMHEPILVLPFIASVLDNETVLVKWLNEKVQVSKNGVKTEMASQLISLPSVSYYSLKIEPSYNPCEIMDKKSRVADDASSSVAILNALAHKTYAPATEASRLAGAGAGLNDND